MQTELSASEQQTLLRFARQTINDAITLGIMPELNQQLANQPDCFGQIAASFVTLHKKNQLRGCIGTAEPYRSLLDDVIHNAFASAFADPRFPPITADELAEVSLEISILTPPQRLNTPTEESLLQQLRPGRDGLTIQCGQYRATFLPQVWGQFPKPAEFLASLKRKAGMPEGLWPDDMACFRYQCISFEET